MKDGDWDWQEHRDTYLASSKQKAVPSSLFLVESRGRKWPPLSRFDVLVPRPSGTAALLRAAAKAGEVDLIKVRSASCARAGISLFPTRKC